MILIQTTKWFGPGRNAGGATTVESTVIHETLATRLSLPEALALLRDYSRQFAKAYGGLTAVEHTVIGIQEIAAEMSDDDLDNARMWTVEGIHASIMREIAEAA